MGPLYPEGDLTTEERATLAELYREIGSWWYPPLADCQAIYHEALKRGASRQQANTEALRFSVASYLADRFASEEEASA